MNQPYPGQPGNGWQHLPPQAYYGQPHAQGYYPPPPPPKRNKTGLWVLLALLAVIVVVAGGVVAFKLYVNRDWTATFEVTGTGTTATVRYSGADRETARKDVDLPWTQDITFSGKVKAFVLDVFPAAETDTVACSVTVNGKVVVEKTPAPGEQAVCLGVNPGASRFG